MEEDRNNRIFLWIVFILFLTGLIFKLLLVFTLPVYHDVGWYISLLEHHDSAYMNLAIIEHPHFGYYPYLLFLEIFGTRDFVIRLVPFLFSLIELALIYLIAKKWFGKKVALYTIILFSLTYFATFNALSPEGDGSIIGVISILLFYCLYEYYSNNNNNSNNKQSARAMLFFTGIFLGVLFLIKVRAILFVFPLFLYSYYKTKNFLRTIKDLFFVGIVSGTIFLIFPLLVYLVSPDTTTFFYLLKKVILHNTGTFSLFYKLTHPLIFLQVLVILSLLLPFLFVKGIQNSTKKEHDPIILLVLWFVSLFLFLLLLLPEGYAGIYPRYIAFLAPPLILLSARGLEQLQLSYRFLTFVFTGSFFGGSLFLYLNQHATEYWYLESAAMGIMKISTRLLITVILLSLVLLLFFFIFTHKKIKRVALLIFLTLSFSFNLLLIGEPLVDKTHEHLLNDLITYYEAHQNTMKQPVFIWAEDLAFYFNISGKNLALMTTSQYKYAKILSYNNQGYYYMNIADSNSMAVLKERGGTVFSFYYPLKYTLSVDGGRKEEYDYLTSHCTLLRTFDYEHAKGVVFEC